MTDHVLLPTQKPGYTIGQEIFRGGVRYRLAAILYGNMLNWVRVGESDSGGNAFVSGIWRGAYDAATLGRWPIVADATVDPGQPILQGQVFTVVGNGASYPVLLPGLEADVLRTVGLETQITAAVDNPTNDSADWFISTGVSGDIASRSTTIAITATIATNTSINVTISQTGTTLTGDQAVIGANATEFQNTESIQVYLNGQLFTKDVNSPDVEWVSVAEIRLPNQALFSGDEITIIS